MSENNQSKSPEHSDQIAAINRIIGQLNSIKKMILDRKCCPDIIQQLRAARGGLVSAEVSILAAHIADCIQDATQSGDEIEIEKKSKELARYVKGLII